MFTTNGVLDREILWPKAQRGAQVAQSVGSDNFQRTFARVDSGKLSEGSELFLSASYTEADKWRGPGESPAGRSNVEIAWSRPLGERANGKLLVAYNDFKADNYRPLSYSQASDPAPYNCYLFIVIFTHHECRNLLIFVLARRHHNIDARL